MTTQTDMSCRQSFTQAYELLKQGIRAKLYKQDGTWHVIVSGEGK